MASSALAGALREPIALPPNPLSRFYRGSGRLAAFRGAAMESPDDRPEDWVGSATRSWTPPGAAPATAGLSSVTLRGREWTLEDLLRLEPEAIAGPALVSATGATLGVLVKLLDAGQRLPVHCHPRRDDASRLLGSRFGKTEAWLILETVEGAQPRAWVGLREEVARHKYRGWIERQDSRALLESLTEYRLSPGDVFFIPAGTPHAIDAGVFLLELQEPTDFSVVAEMGGFPVDPTDASLGLGWERAIDFFDLRQADSPRRRPSPRSAGVSSLFGSEADPFFRALRMRVDGQAEPPFEPAYAVGVVLGGRGVVSGPQSRMELGRGATFALPAAAVAGARIDGDALDLVWCLGPDPAALA